MARWAFGGFCVRMPKEGTLVTSGSKGPIDLPDPSHLKPQSDWPAAEWYDFTMKLNQAFMLPALLRAKPTAAEDKYHRIGSLQFRKLAAFRSVIGKLVVGEDSAWNNVRSHREPPF